LLPGKQQTNRNSGWSAIFHVGEQDSYLVAAGTLEIPLHLRHFSAQRPRRLLLYFSSQRLHP
jgi:hypothetical protein